MAGDLTELRGEARKRLLVASRRSLERTGGALGRSIGLSSPTDAERRVVIGITGSYRPQTVKRLDCVSCPANLANSGIRTSGK